MREGWKTYKLGSICDFHGGSQPPKGEWIKSPKEGYVRMLQIRDFTKSRDFDIEYVRLTDKLRLCKEDDILIGRYGASVGKILTGLAGAYNVAIIKATPDENVVCKSFIRRVFEAPGFQALLGKVSTQRTAQAGFSKEDIADYEVSLPPLPEQQRIVDILDQEFAKIDALKANAEKSLQAAKDLFQATLKKELEPRKGCEVAEINSICLKTDNIKWKDIPEEREYTYIDLTSVDRSSKSVVEPQRIRKSNAPSRAQRLVFRDDIIFATTRPTLRRYCIIPEQYDGQICSTGFCVLRPDKRKVRPSWLFHSLSTDTFYDYVEPLQTGATYPAITDKDVKGYVISLPSIAEQDEIISRLDDLNDKCKALQENYQKTLVLCDDLKQSLLRKAFNGEI